MTKTKVKNELVGRRILRKTKASKDHQVSITWSQSLSYAS